MFVSSAVATPAGAAAITALTLSTGKAGESGHDPWAGFPLWLKRLEWRYKRVGPPVTVEAFTDYATVPAVRALADDLLPAFYEDLRRLAQRERHQVAPTPTLQTTALVHEAYLKLRNTRAWADDRHFLCAAALAMRHALINHAQARLAEKRGGGATHVTLTQNGDLAIESDQELLALNQALEALAQQAPRLARVVECRYFAGYSEPDTARVLGISERTVRRDWTLARAWLHRELAGAA